MNTPPPAPPQMSTFGEGRTRKVDVLEKLLLVFTVDNLDVLASAFLRVQERAVERRTDQSVTVTINDKGYPRFCKASDDVAFTKPKEAG